MNRCLIGLTILLMVGSSACTRAEGRASSATATAQPASFTETFTLVDSVELEQPADQPIVRISGIDVDAEGHILLGDVSEGNVKLFAPDGRLLQVIGRKGDGPGEFQAPRYPRFGPDGLIYVADAQEPRVQVFDRSGTLRRFLRLSDIGMTMGFAVRDDGTFIVASDGTDASPNVLIHYDSAGSPLGGFLALRDVRPTGQPDDRLWGNVRNFYMDVRADTVFVTSSVSDTLWSVHIPTGAEQRTHLTFPNFIKPSLPPKRLPDITALTTWANSFHLGSTLSSDRSRLYLPFVQGVLNYGDPMILLVRDERGNWTASQDAPPIIGAGNGRAYGLLTPGDERVALGIYAPRDR